VSPEAPPKCMNESGCICRGAIFIAAPQVDALDLTTWTALSQLKCDVQSLPKPLSGNGFGEHHDDFLKGSPISGRALRALLASFLI
jgi:hypothetical protein